MLYGSVGTDRFARSKRRFKKVGAKARRRLKMKGRFNGKPDRYGQAANHAVRFKSEPWL